MTKEQKIEIVDVIRPLLHALDVSEFKLTEIRCQGFVGINVFSADFDISFYIESKNGTCMKCMLVGVLDFFAKKLEKMCEN